MYNISDIVHTHRLLLTCNYELCILYSIAHYSHTYMFLKWEVKSHFLCILYIGNCLRTGQLRTFHNFFCESVIEAHCQEWRPLYNFSKKEYM